MKYLAFALCIALALPMSATAADKPTQKAGQKKTEGPPSQPPVAESVSPFNLSEDSLPRNYKGHDCVAVTKRVAALTPAKTEFETKAEYERRTDLSSANILPGLLGSDLVAIVSEQRVWDFSYDADRRLVTIKLSPFRPGKIASNLADPLNIMEAFTHSELGSSVRRYEAANGYGAKVTVSERNVTACGVAVTTKPGRRLANYATVTFPMEPDQAKALKASFTAVLIGTLHAPHLAQITDYKKPTFDSPWEYHMRGDALVIDLKAIWFFNQQTGEVVARLGEGATRESAPEGK